MTSNTPSVFLSDPDVTLWHGDVLETLREFPAESVDCVVTSPPYWGLRDYGTGGWSGGEEGCDHALPLATTRGGPKSTLTSVGARDGQNANTTQTHAQQFRDTCGKCGATRIDQQLGLEPTPEQYVERMVEVFREVRRVLAAHGTVWLNLGDSYAGGGGYSPGSPSNVARQEALAQGDTQDGTFGVRGEHNYVARQRDQRVPPSLKPKDLVGIPWAVAKALQAPYYTGKIKDERERIWLAATVEAEGCLFIHKRKAGTPNYATFTRKDGTTVSYDRKNDTYGAGLEVSSTDRVVVERCMEIAGIGSINEQTPEQNKRRKQTIYRWHVRSNECKWIIRELYPHFIAKQHEARLLLGCPSSGDDASKAWESLKALHQGEKPGIDFAAPESMFEGGWYLRSDIIWSKRPNPMPESVTDRPTKAHEYLFLLSKQPRYFFDQEAVREPHARIWDERNIGAQNGWATGEKTGHVLGRATDPHGGLVGAMPNPAGRNIRSVWEIATQPYPEAHFATFPEELARRAIAAGCPEQVCRVCGKARERITEKVGDAEYHDRWGRPLQRVDQRHYTKDGDSKVHVQTSAGVPTGLGSSIYETRGWTECSCHTRSWEHSDACAWHEGEPCTCKEFKEQDPKLEKSSQSSSKYRPGIVLDPFMGSGTVAHVARKLSRHSIGIDLNAEYLALAARRLQQQSLFAEAL